MRLLTKSVPLSPQAITRALLSPCAQSETLKPGGTLILSTGISPAAFGAGGWGIGASGEVAMLAGCPCFHGRRRLGVGEYGPGRSRPRMNDHREGCQDRAAHVCLPVEVERGIGRD